MASNWRSRIFRKKKPFQENESNGVDPVDTVKVESPEPTDRSSNDALVANAEATAMGASDPMGLRRVTDDVQEVAITWSVGDAILVHLQGTSLPVEWPLTEDGSGDSNFRSCD